MPEAPSLDLSVRGIIELLGLRKPRDQMGARIGRQVLHTDAQQWERKQKLVAYFGLVQVCHYL